MELASHATKATCYVGQPTSNTELNFFLRLRHVFKQFVSSLALLVAQLNQRTETNWSATILFLSFKELDNIKTLT